MSVNTKVAILSALMAVSGVVAIWLGAYTQDPWSIAGGASDFLILTLIWIYLRARSHPD